MKHLFRTVLGLILLIPIAYGNIASAEHTTDRPLYDMSQLKLQQLPMYCGDTAFIFQTAFEIFGEIPIAGAEVRNKGDLNSPVAGILTFTYNEHLNKGTFMITVPRTMQTCILGYGVNWEFFENFKKMILDMESKPEENIIKPEDIEPDNGNFKLKEEDIKVIPSDSHTDLAVTFWQ